MSVYKAYVKRKLKADMNPGSIVIKPKWFAYEALTFLNKRQLVRINRETSNAEKQVRRIFGRIAMIYNIKYAYPYQSS